MLKLTKTGIGLLIKQYRSVLRKCFLLNLGIIALSNTICSSAQALSNIVIGNQTNIGSGGATASAEHSIAIGTYNTFAEGYGSVALGVASSTKGSVDVAIGHGAYAEGAYSLALGANSRAYAYDSVALGAESEANISYAVSVGNDSLKRRIVNVAAGQNDNDVVILKQLNDALNYYYTFRVDERVEVIEFALFLNNEKEMSSLDFMPIKSSSDLRINLIKAEDPLTFSAKTRDDSLGLMEVCHA